MTGWTGGQSQAGARELPEGTNRATCGLEPSFPGERLRDGEGTDRSIPRSSASLSSQMGVQRQGVKALCPTGDQGQVTRGFRMPRGSAAAPPGDLLKHRRSRPGISLLEGPQETGGPSSLGDVTARTPPLDVFSFMFCLGFLWRRRFSCHQGPVAGACLETAVLDGL